MMLASARPCCLAILSTHILRTSHVSGAILLSAPTLFPVTRHSFSFPCHRILENLLQRSTFNPTAVEYLFQNFKASFAASKTRCLQSSNPLGYALSIRHSCCSIFENSPDRTSPHLSSKACHNQASQTLNHLLQRSPRRLGEYLFQNDARICSTLIVPRFLVYDASKPTLRRITPSRRILLVRASPNQISRTQNHIRSPIIKSASPSESNPQSQN